MSDTFQIDPYLVAQKLPTQPENFGTLIEVARKNQPEIIDKHVMLVTPIGRFLNINVDQPKAFSGGPNAGKPASDDPPVPVYSFTLAFGATAQNMLVTDIYRSIVMVANAVWPRVRIVNPQNLNEQIDVNGEYLLQIKDGLSCPLYNGDDKYRQDFKKHAAFRGLWYINAKAFPTDMQGNATPIQCLGPDQEKAETSKFYPGCYGRAVIRIKAYTHPLGGKGINIHFTAVQHASKRGEPLYSFDRTRAAQAAFAAAGQLPTEEYDGPKPMPQDIPGARPTGTWNPGSPVAGWPEPERVATGFQPPNPQPAAAPTFSRPPGVG